MPFDSLCTSLQNGHLKSIDLSHKQAMQLLGERTFLNKLSWNNIPSFAVLTGNNGTGKTQLLHCISIIVKQNYPELNVLYESDFNKSNIVLQKNFSHSGLYDKHLKKKLLDALTKFYLTGDKLSSCLTGLRISDKLKQKIKSDKTLNPNSKEDKRKLDKLIDSYIHDYYQDKHDLANPIETLTFIFKLFDENLQNLQKKYKKMKYLKELKKFYCKIHHENDEKTFSIKLEDPMFQKEIASEYIRHELHQEPPWEEINKLLNEEKMSYNLFWSKSGDISEKEIIFRRKEKNNIALSFCNLSAGEKSVLVLISRLFYFQGFHANGEKKTEDLKKVDIMLLDEPDIHLDAVLCKLFNKIIFYYFVQKHKIQVIMSTHKLETVALAPANSIFIMENEEIKSSVVEAIKRTNDNMQDTLLRSDANKCETTIMIYDGKSIVSPDRKYIYVENEDIAYFYTIVYTKFVLSDFIKPSTTKLVFISVKVDIFKIENLDEINEASSKLLVDYPTNENVMRIHCVLQKLKSEKDNNQVTKNIILKGFDVNFSEGKFTCTESQLFHHSIWSLKNKDKPEKLTETTCSIDCYLSMPLNLIYALYEDHQNDLYKEICEIYQELENSLKSNEKDKITSVLKISTRLFVNALHKKLIKRMLEMPDKVEILNELLRGLSSKNESFFLMLSNGIEIEYPKIFVDGINHNSGKCCQNLLEAICYVIYGKFENKMPEPLKNALCKIPAGLIPMTLLDELNNIGSSCSIRSQ